MNFEKLERKIFNTIVDYATQKGHEKYGFERGEGEHPTWNNESDAFKHTYLSWFLSWFIDDETSKKLGDMHEDETPDAPEYERNMDLWNNAIGREIAFEMQQGISDDFDFLDDKNISDFASRKIWEKMQQGELITDPFNDKRKFENMELERITEKEKIYTDEDLNNLNKQKMSMYLDYIMEQDWKLPTQETLEEKVAQGEVIKVDKYTKADGKVLDGYYLRKPYYRQMQKLPSTNAPQKRQILKGRVANERYIWHSEPNACDVCKSLDGTIFDDEYDIPNKPHPNCKCTVKTIYY